MQSAWAFAAVLDKLNVQCEVIGFTTRRECYEGRGEMRDVESKVSKFAATIGKSARSIRWEALYHPIFKEFGERFGLEQKKRFATAYDDRWAHHHLLQNLDGTSLIEFAKRLLARPEKRKLMIVFSDGEPCSHMDPGVLWEHLKWAVPEIEKNGIEMVGVGIQTRAVHNFYKKAFVVNKLEELPAKVMGELKRFLTA
jgi:cobalamin biosynthesis protein CobT